MTGMRYVITLLLLLPLMANHASARGRSRSGNMAVRVGVGGGYEATNFTRPTGGDAVFSGLGFSTWAEMKSNTNGYGLGLKLSVDSMKLGNTSNSDFAAENLKGLYVSLVPRFYALDLYFGLGLTYSSVAYSRNVSSVITEDSYSGIGVRLELGYDWYFASRAYLTPLLTYSVSKVRAASATGSYSYIPFTAGLGLAIEF
jgi:hypothetical protein